MTTKNSLKTKDPLLNYFLQKYLREMHNFAFYPVKADLIFFCYTENASA